MLWKLLQWYAVGNKGGELPGKALSCALATLSSNDNCQWESPGIGRIPQEDLMICPPTIASSDTLHQYYIGYLVFEFFLFRRCRGQGNKCVMKAEGGLFGDMRKGTVKKGRRKKPANEQRIKYNDIYVWKCHNNTHFSANQILIFEKMLNLKSKNFWYSN